MAVLKCESCGAKVKTEEGKFTATCEYCGTEMIIFESTAEFEVDSKGTLVQYNGKGGDIVLPDEIRVIGKGCFKGNDRIFSVKLPESVVEIKENAFDGCTELETINLPDGMENIGAKAFLECASLRKVKIPENVFTLKKLVFGDCKKLSDIEFNKSLRAIGEWAFSGCSEIVSLKLPENVKRIEKYAFKGCNRLVDLEICEKVEIIGENAFSECVSLENVVISNNSELTEIGERAFYRCSNLNTFDFPANLKVIGKYAFADSGLKKAMLNDGLTAIDMWAFNDCNSLVKVRVPGTVKMLGYRAFSSTSIKTIRILPGVSVITANAFVNNGNEGRAIYLPETIKELQKEAFGYKGSMDTIYSPDNKEIIRYSKEHRSDWVHTPSEAELKAEKEAKEADKLRQINKAISDARVNILSVTSVRKALLDSMEELLVKENELKKELEKCTGIFKKGRRKEIEEELAKIEKETEKKRSKVQNATAQIEQYTKTAEELEKQLRK